jgi:hypothetical protein
MSLGKIRAKTELFLEFFTLLNSTFASLFGFIGEENAK